MNAHDEQTKSVELNETKGRRRFVRGVGAAVPVALTVSARSAMACNCNAVSAHASINMPINSHNATQDIGLSSTALSPSVLAGKSSTFFGPVGGLVNPTFNSVFPGGDSRTMERVLKSTTTATTTAATPFEKHLAAAYVNRSLNRSPIKCYTVPDLQKMWQDSPYHPVPGVNWDQFQIMAYLVDTWT